MKTSSDITSARRRPVAAAAAAAATVDIFKVLFSSPVLVSSIYHRFLPQHCPCAMCERTSACMCLRPCLFARPPLRTSSSLLLSRQTAAGACIRGRLSRHQHRTRPFTAVGVIAFDGRIDLRRHLANDYTIMHRARPSDFRLSSAPKNPRQRQYVFGYTVRLSVRSLTPISLGAISFYLVNHLEMGFQCNLPQIRYSSCGWEWTLLKTFNR